MEQVTGYSDLTPVGQGGFGIVYRARQEHLGRTVALKVLLCDTLNDRALRRFRQECQLIGELTGHPHVVTVLEAGTARSGRPYIAMEYHEGGSLRDRLAREGPLPLGEVLEVGGKVAGALAAAHEAGIVHRDVKPQNILMSRFGEPALSDFGIATLLDGAEFPIHDDAFTPHHAPPEVLEGQPPSPASDIYSLGSTLYQLLTGQLAHREGERGVTPHQPGIASEEPPDPAHSGVPAPVMEVMRKAMARRPEDRFGSALSFAERLQRLQRELGLPVTEVANARGDLPAAEAPTHRVTSLAQERTVAGPRSQLPPASERKARRVWQPGRTAGIAVAGIVAAGLVGALGIGAFTVLSQAPARRAVASSPPAARQAPVSPAIVSAAQPQQLTAVDGGTAVVLHWQLRAGGPQYPLLVQQVASGQAAAALTFLDRGTMTAMVSGLDPRGGYCFRVGALVATGSPATISWSQPVCIRGAIPEPTPTAT